jgi:hypothetical protein
MSRVSARRGLRCSGRVAASLLLVLVCAVSRGEQTPKRLLTVADAIQTTRFMQSASSAAADPRDDGVFVSPDGKSYAVMLIRGDLQRAEGAGNWVDIMAGRLESLESAKPRLVKRLFTESWGSPDPVYGVPSLTWPRQNPLLWLPDNERVAFRWPDDKDVVQVATLNLNTGEFAYVTQADGDVTSFQLTPSGGVLYSALFRHSRARSEQLMREGFKVEDADVLDVIRGDVDGEGAIARANDTRWSIAGPGGPPRRLSPDGDDDRSAPLFPAVFSADGRRALLGYSPARVPPEWSRYTERVMSYRMTALKANPRALTARYIKQLFVADLESGEMRPLWNAPAGQGTQASWSPDAHAVLVGPVFLPLDGADASGVAGRAIAVVDVETGRYVPVRLPAEHASQPIRALRWIDAERIEVVHQKSALRFRKGSEGWMLEESVPTPPALPRETSALRVEWRQDAATPPVLYAVSARGGRERAVLDPNPGLTQRFQLGRVEFITWKDSKGRDWHGRLYHPVRSESGGTRRAPLVIQTHGFAPPGEFSLYGYGVRASGAPGLGPGISVYAAQPLAARGIAVLQMEDLPGDLARLTATPEEADAYVDAYESAVRFLDSRALIDPQRVGLVGFSRTGWHVAYALTHSQMHFAAALISDSFMGGYFAAAFLDWGAEISQDVGAEPFGDGLRTWLERAPAFNVEKLTTPLRIQMESSGLTNILVKWELYSRARHLHKPVELYVLPNVERGSHGIQNPLQCLAAQQGAVDWFASRLLPRSSD